MATINNRKELVGHLNEACLNAFENASNLCVSYGHINVTIEHLLCSLCEQSGNDIRNIFNKLNKDIDVFKENVSQSFNRFKHLDGELPSLSSHLFDLFESAWLISSLELNETKIRSGALLLALLRETDKYCRYEYIDYLEKLSPEVIKTNFLKLTEGSIEQVYNDFSTSKDELQTNPHGETSALDKYAENFTEQARQGKIDPVFCRDNEIQQIIDILARRRKNNPICVGEAGVGKTAVVEGLSLRIVNDEVPLSLIGAEIYGLDMGALEAGASVKGEFEKRLKSVLDEVKKADKNIILFIDEAHTLIGAGNNAGGSDAANLLKPALARGEIKTIAATTWSEYKKYFEKDPALTRRFQLVKLDEPTVEQTCTIVRGLVPAYEKAHDGVYISEAGVEAAVKLSSRYVTGRQLPDKAIDVLDTACARVKAAKTGVPLIIEKLTHQEQAFEREKLTLERDLETGHEEKSIAERIVIINENYAKIHDEKERLIKIHSEQKGLVEKLQELRAKAQTDNKNKTLHDEIVSTRNKFDALRKDKSLISLEVGPEEIASVISDWTGIPVSSMAQDEIDKLLNLKKNIQLVIKGQDQALQIIQEQLQSSRLDLHKSGRPLGVFLLVGPSGVGKTETAIQVCNKLFGGEQFMTSVNMTEFQEKHTVSRLIGSPPGYVGYGEGGLLTEAIRKKPYSVVLLDEVEKADPDVLNLFYQVFDKGVLTDGEGREIDCKNVIFFLCSNLATSRIIDLTNKNKNITAEEVLQEIKPALSEHFKPALLARMQPIIYMPLNQHVMQEIIKAKLDDLKHMFMSRQGISFSIDDKAVKHLEMLCNEASSGARLIDQLIQKRILPTISNAILERRLAEKTLTRVYVSVSKSGDFSFSFNEKHPFKSNGKKVIQC
ncbi:type VI secretion system ATPase TssH [uncultured Bartonella sp.]|uniref:type VI secretion system ATPase TssH n=1 Tax=uncultured Bartonella sp. TaxID=104108 RepID=UPI00262AF239|nr:type VI secretion system ATPase TssH [uncultured Bartonella sp.]